jgi:hypothetical protein
MAAKKPAAPASTASAADLLNELSDLVPKTEKPKAGAKQKWEVVLTGYQAEVFGRWISAKNVSEVVDTRLENSKEELCEFALGVVAEAMFKSKTRPINPTLVVKKAGSQQVDSQAVYLFSDKFKYRFPEVPDGVKARDFFVQTFEGLGLTKGDAEKLVDQELDLNPVVGLRPLTELTQGKYGEKRQYIESTAEEKEAGRKLMLFLTGKPDENGQCTVEALTPQERALIIKRDPGIKVKAGFYGRVCNYAHSVDQLKAIFKVIVPIAYPAHQKFGLNDTPEVRAKRLIDATADIIGVAVVDDKDSDD